MFFYYKEHKNDLNSYLEIRFSQYSAYIKKYCMGERNFHYLRDVVQ